MTDEPPLTQALWAAFANTDTDSFLQETVECFADRTLLRARQRPFVCLERPCFGCLRLTHPTCASRRETPPHCTAAFPCGSKESIRFGRMSMDRVQKHDRISHYGTTIDQGSVFLRETRDLAKPLSVYMPILSTHTWNPSRSASLVTRGYLNQPAKTTSVFVPNTFSTDMPEESCNQLECDLATCFDCVKS